MVDQLGNRSKVEKKSLQISDEFKIKWLTNSFYCVRQCPVDDACVGESNAIQSAKKLGSRELSNSTSKFKN